MLFKRVAPSERQVLVLTDPPDVVYAVGDIHGCFDLYQRLEAAIIADARAQRGRKLIIVLGDMIDRGPGSAAVVAHMQRPVPDAITRLCLAGNHEDMLCRFLDAPRVHADWLAFGGRETLRSYGVAPDRSGAYVAGRGLVRRMQAAIAAADLTFLRGLPAAVEIRDLVFAHAGYDLARSAGQQDVTQLIWGPPEATDSYTGRRRLVHGHQIVPEIESSAVRINVDLGAYQTGHLGAMRFNLLDGTERAIRI